MKHLVLIATLLGSWREVHADTSTYILPITRSGKRVNRVASNFWSGEYPKPVINVHSKQDGGTTIKAYKSLRSLDTLVECTIKNGIYHPWSKTKSSAIAFYSISALKEYSCSKKQTLGAIALEKKDKLSEVTYLSEGRCRAKVGHKKEMIEFSCEVLSDTDKFKPLHDSDDEFLEQWIQVKCDEKFEAFVQDSDLLKQKGILEGTILGFGKVE